MKNGFVSLGMLRSRLKASCLDEHCRISKRIGGIRDAKLNSVDLSRQHGGRQRENDGKAIELRLDLSEEWWVVAILVAVDGVDIRRRPARRTAAIDAGRG